MNGAMIETILKKPKNRTYICDICVKCGKVVNFEMFESCQE